MRGRFMLRTLDPEGNITQEIPWFDNLITNQGLDQIGGYQPAYNAGGPFINIACSVGTSTTAPANTDTQQGAFLAAYPASGSAITSTTSAYNAGGGTPYWSDIWVYTFPAGVATGTLSEIGVGNWTSPSDTQPWLFSHALITSGGSPTTITVLATESLQVTYELDYYINITTNTYSFVMSTVTYSGSYLRAAITSPPALNETIQANAFGNNAPWIDVSNGTTTTVTGSINGSGSGGQAGCTTVGSTYTNGTYFYTFTTSFSISQGNVSGGISALQIIHPAHGQYQFSVSPAIPKTSSYQMTLTYAYSWARYP